MNLVDIEYSFNRAFFLSFSKKKLLLVFPVLVLCGILVVFCRALAYHSGGWIAMSMIFLPVFLSSGILLSIGVLLIRIYYQEIKRNKISYREIIKSSWEMILGVSYLCLPVIMIYLCFWIVLGIFLLLQSIPFIGPIIGVILSFAPFVIISLSIVLGLIMVGLLFFMAPAMGLKSMKTRDQMKLILKISKERFFSCFLYFIVGILPIIFVVGVLTLAAVVTGVNFFVAERMLTVILEWFFIMVPFCAFLTPSIIFFFNFSAEAFNNLQIEKVE